MKSKKTTKKWGFPKLSDFLPLPINSIPKITGVSGSLSTKKIKAIIRKLKNKRNDFLEKEILLEEAFSKNPLVTGNKATLLIDGLTTYESMLEAIRNAKYYIYFETFIFEDDVVGRRFANLLLKKNAEGVKIYLIYDSFGCMSTPRIFFKRLMDKGIKVYEFNPVNPFKFKWNVLPRNHRKILIVDGKTAFTGGLNIGTNYSPLFCGFPGKYKKNRNMMHCWRDTHIKIEGPAVAEFEKLFFAHWPQPMKLDQKFDDKLKEQGNSLIRVISSSPGRPNRGTYLMYLSAIANAKKTIYVNNSFFVPNKKLIKAIIDAAERGVDVQIVLPKAIDSLLPFYAGRSNYAVLLKSGVRIYEIGVDTILHAKTAVIDSIWSTVGSTNLDFLSLYWNDEVNAVILDYNFAKKLESIFLFDIKHAKQVTLEAWKKRPFKERIKDFFPSLFYFGL